MVRETKKQDGNPQDVISKERGTEVKIKDDVLLLNWILHFAGQILEQAENWVSPTKGTIWKDDLVSKDWRRYQLNFETKDSSNLCLSPRSKENHFVYCQEWRCARPQLDKSDLE